MLDNKSLFAPEAVEALHADFGDQKVELDEIADRAEGMEQAARESVDGVTTNSEHLGEYGETLVHLAIQLGKDSDVLQSPSGISGAWHRNGAGQRAKQGSGATAFSFHRPHHPAQGQPRQHEA